MTQRISFFATESPLEKFIDFIVPLVGAGSAFSIFMASRTTTVSPSLTASPTCFSYLTIIPGIGAVRGVPSVVGTAAGAGSGGASFAGAGAAGAEGFEGAGGAGETGAAGANSVGAAAGIC